MAKDIEIGGRLHSIATGNIVSGANEVFDDTEEKRQSEINEESARIGSEYGEAIIPEIGAGDALLTKPQILTDKQQEDVLANINNKEHNSTTYGGMGRVFLKKNMIFTGYHFEGFVNDVTVETSSLAGTPDAIVFDNDRLQFLAVKNQTLMPSKYYMTWSDETSSVYINPSESDIFICDSDNKAYWWNGSSLALKIDGEKTNVLTQEMMSDANTIYIIQYDFTLGEDITVPANCVLKFDGGSISGNNVVNLNNCLIEAPNSCIFKGVAIQGTTNDIFNLCWLINEDDITNTINSLPNTIKKIVFNSDKNYYLSDTATFTAITYLDWNARVYYNGNKANISVLKITNCNAARINISGLLSGENSLAIDQINDNTNVVGLDIVNCQSSTFYIAQIAYFNENLRLSGLGAGCCNNKVFYGKSTCANRHLRIYQNDVDGKSGWTNENYFYGGHFINFSSWKNQNKKSTAIHIEGGNDDNYNKVNALTFINFNVEGYGNMNGYTIYAKNAIYCSFLRIRNEGGDYFMKTVGNCKYIDIDCSFGNADVDISECSQSNPLRIRSAAITNSITVDLEKEIKKTKRNNYVTSDILTSQTGKHVWYNSGTSFSGLTFNYDDVVKKVLYIKQTKGIVTVSFVKDGQVVAPLPTSIIDPFYRFESGIGYTTSSGHYFDTILIPAGLDVDKVCVGIKDIRGTLTVSSNANLFYDKRITPIIGAYADVPTDENAIPLGHEYYCTDLGKKILWNGTTWVDTTGVTAGTSTSGTFANKPTVSANNIPVGFRYFCTDRQTTEGATDGIEIIHKGNDVWVDAFGRVVS